jgi:hypothetical protein
MGSVISIDRMHQHQWSRYAKRFRDDLHDIEQPLTIPIRRFDLQRAQIIRHGCQIWGMSSISTHRRINIYLERSVLK